MRKLWWLWLLVASVCGAQGNDSASFAAGITQYDEIPNIVYQKASGYEAKLDVYKPHNATQPVPVVVQIHGGGWIAGTKEGDSLRVLPYLQMGFAAVNVEYRMAEVALAPAAVEDCRCALHWVFANAKKYNFDVNRVVVTGGSAGGHLALMTGMLTPAAGFDKGCWGEDEDVWTQAGGSAHDPHVAAIVNWFGITDLLDITHGPNTKGYGVVWIGDQPNADEIAKRVSPISYVSKNLSPISYVSKNLPPIFTVHGDADKLVPYDEAVRLNQALETAGVPHQLYTVHGGGHGDFSPEDNQKIWIAIREFLAQHVMR